MSRRLPLSTRLAVNHGVLIALLVIALLVTLQGVIRMLGIITDIRDQYLSSIDEQEEIHRSAWQVEVALRHAHFECQSERQEIDVHRAVLLARDGLNAVLAKYRVRAPRRLLTSAERYLELADRATSGDTCAFALDPKTDEQRTALDEELTDAWMDLVHKLHADLSKQEERSRGIGVWTAAGAFTVATVGALAAVLIARSTARSISEPMRRLAAETMRIGEGDFAPIPKVAGPREIEDLWRDLERTRERLAELDRLKQSFLANVSHELRSPLARLREALGLLFDGTCGPLNERQLRVLTLANRACEREVQLVNALLDMSRLNSGMALKRDAACRLDRIIQAALDGERTEANERGVVLEVASRGSIPPMDLDSALMERAVANLVRNAVSVSRRGQRVRIERSLSKDDDRAFIDVIDEGPGFTTKAKDSAFRPFSAADIPDVDRPAGIGLGLSFAKEVARAHGGLLTILRSDRTGTTIRIELSLGPLPRD
ncbi:HAMP domain-containing histidine kinase [Pendulispora brunnea]|uniref:histidine kinase n=1 Tax=Pendulispora brunnea TaxID=2905690 RepID=A0ABZ2K0C6_9BACT